MAALEMTAAKAATEEEEGTPEWASRSDGMGELAVQVPSPEVRAATAVG